MREALSLKSAVHATDGFSEKNFSDYFWNFSSAVEKSTEKKEKREKIFFYSLAILRCLCYNELFIKIKEDFPCAIWIK